MVDKNDISSAEAIARSVEKVSDSKGLESIGNALGVGLMALGFALIIAAITFGSKWDGRLFPEPKCYELKEISGRVFRMNTCTGEATEIEAIDVDSESSEPD